MLNRQLLALFIATGLAATFLNAQEDELASRRHAVVAFDVRFDMIQSSELANVLDIGQQLSFLAENSDSRIDVTKLKRLSGAVGAPEDIGAAQTFMTGQSLGDLVLRLEFVEKEVVDELFSEIEKQEPTIVRRDNKIYYDLPGYDETSSVLYHRHDNTTVDIGTGAYVFQSSPESVYSIGLRDIWSQLPDEAIRVAIDFEGARELIEEIVDASQQMEDPGVLAFVDFIENAKAVWLSVDFQQEHLLTFNAVGFDARRAKKLRSAFDSILGAVKLSAMAAGPQISDENAAAKRTFESILESLNAESDGSQVRVTIPKPAGFERAAKSLYESIGPMGLLQMAGGSANVYDEEYANGVVERLREEGLSDEFESELADLRFDRLDFQTLDTALSGFDLTCEVTVTSEKPGAIIRYQLVTSSLKERFDEVSASTESMPMGTYYLWLEREGVATSSKDTFRITKTKHEIEIEEKE